MAIEMKPYNVACVTLYPGAVLTETMASVLNVGMEVRACPPIHIQHTGCLAGILLVCVMVSTDCSVH